MNQEWINALMGGLLIGISVSFMLLLNGRVTGISGILNGLLRPLKGDIAWRIFFIAGLFFGGLILRLLNPNIIKNNFIHHSFFFLIIAGFLVGFGTILGNGCTSGHGICGISRLSIRSIIATLIFVTVGIFSVFLSRL